MIRLITLFLLLTFSASGATLYCSPGGSGAGAHFSDLKALPNNADFVRGNTYVVIDGDYGHRTFKTGTSGSTWITIRKASVEDSGVTGYSSELHNNQATFNSWRFETSYWLLDGVSGGGPYSWETGLGFYVGGSTAYSPVGNNAVAGITDITIRHTELTCNANVAPPAQTGIYWPQSARRMTFSYNFLHDVPGDFAQIRGWHDFTVEYCKFSRNYQLSSGVHGDIFEHDQAGSNHLFRYNYFDEAVGTYLMGHHSTGHLYGFKSYGNIIHKGNTGLGICANITRHEFDAWETVWDWKIYNNTIVLHTSQAGCQLHNGGTGGDVQNNVWYANLPDTVTNEVVIGGFAHDWNYVDAKTDYLAEPNGIVVDGTSPFVAYLSEDFNLSAPLPGNSLADEYSYDMFGNRRGQDGVWDMGALEYGGAADTNAPTISAEASVPGATNATLTFTTSESCYSFVEYGLTTSYGSISTNSILRTSHSFTATGLTPTTTYHWRAAARDYAGNWKTNADQSFVTGEIDVTIPTVSLTAPANGSVLSNSITFTATASDNAAVSSVTFYRSPLTSLGTDTTSPYSVVWATTYAHNGTNTYYAKATDSSGNVGYSGTNTLIIENAPPDTNAPSPTVWWKFNNNATDSIAGKELTASNEATYASGYYDEALSLDGVNDFVSSVTNVSEVDVTGQALSFAVWVNIQEGDAYQIVFGKPQQEGYHNDPYFAYHVYAYDTGSQWRPHFSVCNSTGNRVTVAGATTRNFGEWVHLAGTYDGGNIILYVNGAEDNSEAHSGNVISYTVPLYVGANGKREEMFKGLIDDLKLWNGTVLTAEQVEVVYNSVSDPTEIPTVPGSPSLQTITLNNQNKPLLNWTAPATGGGNITNYLVYRGTSSSSYDYTNATLGNVITWTDTNSLSAATTYYYRVAAENAVGVGAQSGERNVSTPSPPSVSTSTVGGAPGGAPAGKALR